MAGVPCYALRKAWAAFGGGTSAGFLPTLFLLLSPKSAPRNKYIVCKLKTRNDLYVYKPSSGSIYFGKGIVCIFAEFLHQNHSLDMNFKTARGNG